jgi:hypothetical protein
MHRSPPIAAVLLAAAMAILLALTIVAAARGENRPGFNPAQDRALDLYEECWQKFKPDNPCGRNKVDDGVLRKDGTVRDPTGAEVATWTDRLDRIAHPVVVASSEPAGTYYEPPTSSSGGLGCTGMEAESGTAGYSAVSPDGQYVGCYQIDEELHYGSGGVCEGLGTDPAGQDACAANICASQGSGAWTNAAGASPC